MDLEILHSTVRISTPLILCGARRPADLSGRHAQYRARRLHDRRRLRRRSPWPISAAAWCSAILAAVGASMLLAALMALFNLRFRAHIFIAGMAVTFLAYGLTALLLKGVFGQEGVFTSDRHSNLSDDRVPVIAGYSGHWADFQRAYASRLSSPICWCRSSPGPSTGRAGVSGCAWSARRRRPPRRRASTSTASSSRRCCCPACSAGSRAPIFRSPMCTLFAKEMTNERGLIALAAIFFARGNPYLTAAVALLFGAATALSVTLPQVTGLAPQLFR